MKNILVTAGTTQVPIDRVRALTNVFRGRTGTEIALYLAGQSHNVTLVTSNPDLLAGRINQLTRVLDYRTYDELFEIMKMAFYYHYHGSFDVVIHSAAVSDYKVAGVSVMDGAGNLAGLDSSGKVSSDHNELFLRLVRTEKIIDLIRQPWGFGGYLVKFKLQVGITDSELLEIAEKSRITSSADMIVANCLEWAAQRAYVMTEGKTIDALRQELPQLIEQGMLEALG
ncbi:MAG: phosphopantothenoylcysteine decarboxylase [Patescibacteria group bacterium]